DSAILGTGDKIGSILNINNYNLKFCKCRMGEDGFARLEFTDKKIAFIVDAKDRRIRAIELFVGNGDIDKGNCQCQ
ncbi:MAG: hypothetical protein N2053_11795, partial [Chitinispirillaceae bacterium]|nr:hypothetical protein [Chitinispirillaceae bacterium]